MESAQERYKIIKEITTQDGNLLNISWLCDIAEVSRSGYYSWCNNQEQRDLKEEKDKEEFELVLSAFNHRGYDKGARGIHMRLLHMGIRMNIKKIRRLMKKFNLICPIRKANSYKKIAQANQASKIAPNLVNRNFIQEPRQIILTDITYLFYGPSRRKVYLSVMKDAFTNEILAYVVSKSLEVDFVLLTVNQLFEKHGDAIKAEETVMHSDQGVHYTSIAFQQVIKDKKLRQSMSRRANCWDNAPQESFFGHMKDEIDISKIKPFEELVAAIDDYMDYYNNERYQWDLEKLSPAEYYQYWLSDMYPIQV